ncbi:hypothetical protein NGM99_04520 [Mesorhizobium sp. RP14(2022)]|uniref:Uncharacterized protein n=1 Tax=Mesorhizobium liriopis TaxID=2953882 RepID=A0ABT1C2K7_9HYPH|nr:hypothetical protein [Mesorhizobium liriopis]MCO6049054.1 hypothetical protein [Mesorhizobium liriopis]
MQRRGLLLGGLAATTFAATSRASASIVGVPPTDAHLTILKGIRQTLA